ncbi:uncharacterized protein LOC111040466 [Myzus persicae]|uniref:uncharacterized protein LOC111040466 n=1 Tax=Myzus persicae TaxID=13164 RepID=UPI000B937C24|nr:uncharacterized protein LOC111040466 [Myzus persicae]
MDVRISKRLCEKLSSNRTRERDMCTPNHIASYYRVGDDGWDVQCQPACFHMKNKKTYDKDGEIAVMSPWLNYAFGECRLVPEQMATFLEKPFHRTDVVYERRVNDMPTGFSRRENLSDTYGCGFTYVNNNTYCNYFDRTMIPSAGKTDGPCGFTGTEKVVDAVVGMSLINTVKSAVRTTLINSTSVPFSDPVDLVRLPTKLENVMPVDGWRADVNRAFVPPELVSFWDNGDDDGDDLGRRRRHDVSETPNDYSHEKTSTDDRAGEVKKTVKKTIKSLLDMVKSEEFWINISTAVAFDKSLTYIRKICVKTIATLQPLLTDNMVALMRKSYSKAVVQGTARSMAKTMMLTSVMQLTGKSALMLARVTVSVTNPVSWILAVTSVLDFVFTWWDPFGYDNMLQGTFPADYIRKGEIEMRQRLKVIKANYTFDAIVYTVLHKNEIDDATLFGFVEQSVLQICMRDSIISESICPPFGKKAKFEVETIQTRSPMYGCDYMGNQTQITTAPLFHLWLERPVETRCETVSSVKVYVLHLVKKQNSR